MLKLRNILKASLLLFIISCATPIKKYHWDKCESLCRTHEGVMEACEEIRLGRGCHCNDETIFWFDKNWEIAPN